MDVEGDVTNERESRAFIEQNDFHLLPSDTEFFSDANMRRPSSVSGRSTPAVPTLNAAALRWPRPITSFLSFPSFLPFLLSSLSLVTFSSLHSPSNYLLSLKLLHLLHVCFPLLSFPSIFIILRKMRKATTSSGAKIFATAEGESEEKAVKTYDPFSWRKNIVKKNKISNFTDVIHALLLVGVFDHIKVSLRLWISSCAAGLPPIDECGTCIKAPKKPTPSPRVCSMIYRTTKRLTTSCAQYSLTFITLSPLLPLSLFH